MDSWVFEGFMLADEPFAEFLRIFENCVQDNKNLNGKLISSLKPPTTFMKDLMKVTSRPFFILDFNLLNYKIKEIYI